jgi:hypothetical protein
VEDPAFQDELDVKLAEMTGVSLFSETLRTTIPRTRGSRATDHARE